jgi:hypothetical protein
MPLRRFVNTRARESRYVTTSLERRRRACFTEARSFWNPGQVRQVAVNAVHQVNAQLLDIICASARSTNPRFPFSEPLRARFTSLSASQRERLVSCGTLRVDVDFSDPGRWRSVAESLEKSAVQTPTEPAHWLPPDEAILLTHSTLLVAWSVLHGLAWRRAHCSGHRLTPPETAGMTVNHLSYVAQGYPTGSARDGWTSPRFGPTYSTSHRISRRLDPAFQCCAAGN